jgi:GT2 family glycosyltransferase
MTLMDKPKVSIIICSIGRKDILNRCIKSIQEQTFKDYEIILCEEEGNLVELKDKGWQKSKGDIIVWCDDDIIAEPKWLENIVTIFDTRKDVVGVTGPTFVPKEHLKNRDIFRGSLIHKFYSWFFLEGNKFIPGMITSCGANTLGGDYETKLSKYPREVDFLQPAQFAIRRWVVEEVRGFDLEFKGVAEWCDVDLCYRIKNYGKLIYHPEVKVTHYPITDKTTNKRLDTKTRYTNYCRWADKYIDITFKHRLYRLFLWVYFKLKGWKLI